MTVALHHEHVTRARLRSLVVAVFPQSRFGAFEAHYAPVEEGLERLPPFRPLLSYNFAIATC